MGKRSGYIYWDVEARIDVDDVIDQIDDEAILAEVTSRGLHMPKAVANYEDDVHVLRRAIHRGDWVTASIYLDRVFPECPCDPNQMALLYKKHMEERRK